MCLGAVPWAASRASGQAGPGKSSYSRARPDGPALLAGEAPRRTRIAFSAVGDHQRIQHYHQRCGRGQGEHSSPRRGWRPCDAGGTHRLLPSAAIGSCAL
jgi:hypothetical protein